MAGKARATVTLEVLWSVNKETAGSSTALSALVFPIYALKQTAQESTPVSSHLNHGSRKRLEVCTGISIINVDITVL